MNYKAGDKFELEIAEALENGLYRIKGVEDFAVTERVLDKITEGMYAYYGELKSGEKCRVFGDEYIKTSSPGKYAVRLTDGMVCEIPDNTRVKRI